MDVRCDAIAKMKDKRRTLNSKVKKNNQREESNIPNFSRDPIDMSPNIYPNPDIDNIPTNDTGTFIENITVRCSFCTQRFDRPDEYRLHHGEKHAKIYGILPDKVTNSAQEDNTINAKAENSTTLEVINNAALIRKRRPSCAPSVSYVDDDIDSSSSSDSDNSDNNADDKSPENSEQRLQEPGTSSNDLPEKTNDRERTESRKTRTRLLKNSKERDSSSSSDSSLEHDIRNTINKFVQKLSKKLMTHLKNKILKDKINQKNIILYKCNKCSLHFLKKRKFFKHLKRGKHTELQQAQCEHCMLQFSKRSIRKHVKMHMTNERIDKNKRFKILTENDCCFDDSSNSSISEHSGSDDDDQIGVPLSEPESINKPVKENQDLKTNLEMDNVKNHAHTLQTNSKRLKKILYKCDDCEEHFLSRVNAEIHTRNSTHHRIGKNTICNQCTYKFSSPATLSQHERLHHIELNLSKDDFKVITLTKFAPNKIRTLISKRKISEIQKKNVDKKQKLVNEPVDRALLYRCEGCKQSLTSKTTLLRHIRNCEGKSSRKYLCEKCQLYFITKYTLARHVKVHKKYPQLKKENFMVISRKPRIQKNTSVPQSNIVSTTEGNHNDSVMEQDHSKSINMCENDSTCKVKLSKSTENCWSVVSNNEKNGERSLSFNRHNNNMIHKDQQMTINYDKNKTATSTSVEQNFGNDNNVTEHPDTIGENEISVDSTKNSNHESYLTSTVSGINAESTNNRNPLNLAETNVGNISEQNMVVKSAYFQTPHVRTVELNADGMIIDKKEYSKNNEHSDAHSSRVIYQNKSPEICDRNDNPRNENESLKEDIVDNDGIIETQKNFLNPTGIKIANSYSITLKFEDSDTQEPSSMQVIDENDTELSNSPNLLPETKNKCDIVTFIKDEIIKQENFFTDKNVTVTTETNIMTASQISYRHHDNSFHHSDDSQNTLMLVDDDDQRDELADENLDLLNVIHSNKSNISNPKTAILINKSTECSGEADCNVQVEDFENEHAVLNGTNNIDSQEIKDKADCSKPIPSYKNINENCTGKTSTLNFVDERFRVRDRRESSREVIKDNTTSDNIKKESVTKGQNKNRKQIIQNIVNQEVIVIRDSDDDDNDEVVIISKNVETVDLT